MHEQPEPDPIPIPPTEPLVGNAVPPVDPPDGDDEEEFGGLKPPLPEIAKTALRKALGDDPCMRRLELRLMDAERRMRPNQRVLDGALLEVIAAYTKWQKLRNMAVKAEKEVGVIKAEMDQRRLGVKDREQTRQIKRMRRFLGAKYNQGPL